MMLKTCGCGQSHNAHAWESLRLVGRWCFPETEDFPEEHLELRDCTCGSTLSVPIDHVHSCTLNPRKKVSA